MELLISNDDETGQPKLNCEGNYDDNDEEIRKTGIVETGTDNDNLVLLKYFYGIGDCATRNRCKPDVPIYR
jgi:hypothetical protein